MVPLTLFVPAVGVVDQRRTELTIDAGQAGVAAAVLDLKMDDVEGDLCLIASVWIGPQADDEEAVSENTRDATVGALELGAAGGPWHGNLTSIDVPENPNFRRTSREG
ncbi:MAG TPA: formaldehyde-activating enzyme [Ilumatobacter sp.]|nr:formaldehyde-activating enzyme [Ilumatobacter sp.]